MCKIPCNDIGDGMILSDGRGTIPPGLQIFLKGHKQIHSGNQQVISLKFIAVGGLICPNDPF